MYRASDGQATSSLGTVSITVNGINEAPVALAQAVTTPEETAVAIEIKAPTFDPVDVVILTP